MAVPPSAKSSERRFGDKKPVAVVIGSGKPGKDMTDLKVIRNDESDKRKSGDKRPAEVVAGSEKPWKDMTDSEKIKKMVM